MSATRTGASLLAVVLAAAHLPADDKKEDAAKVTLAELKKDPEKYKDKLIQFEATLSADPVASKSRSLKYLVSIAEDEKFFIRSDKVVSKLEVAKGDRVLITGTFSYSKPASGVPTLSMRLEAKSGKVEKLSAKKE